MNDQNIRQLRKDVVLYARKMFSEGLVTGTSGNISARGPAAPVCVVTPSGVDYDLMEPEDLVLVDLEGNLVEGRLKPSVDTMNHVSIYRARPDVGGVVHTHSTYAAAFSVLQREIPALITESAGYLGGAVGVMEYLPPATPELGDRAAIGLGQARAVLLPNHGVIAVGENIKKAYHAAFSVEVSAKVAYLAAVLGNANPVPEGEVERMHEFIHHRYGQR